MAGCVSTAVLLQSKVGSPFRKTCGCVYISTILAFTILFVTIAFSFQIFNRDNRTLRRVRVHFISCTRSIDSKHVS